jgi:hypothetical protein
MYEYGVFVNQDKRLQISVSTIRTTAMAKKLPSEHGFSGLCQIFWPLYSSDDFSYMRLLYIAGCVSSSSSSSSSSVTGAGLRPQVRRQVSSNSESLCI